MSASGEGGEGGEGRAAAPTTRRPRTRHTRAAPTTQHTHMPDSPGEGPHSSHTFINERAAASFDYPLTRLPPLPLLAPACLFLAHGEQRKRFFRQLPRVLVRVHLLRDICVRFDGVFPFPDHLDEAMFHQRLLGNGACEDAKRRVLWKGRPSTTRAQRRATGAPSRTLPPARSSSNAQRRREMVRERAARARGAARAPPWTRVTKRSEHQTSY